MCMDKHDTTDVMKMRIERAKHSGAVARIKFERFAFDIFA